MAPHECLRCKKEGSLLCSVCANMLPGVSPRCYRCKRWEEGYQTCRRCRKHSVLFSVRPVTLYGDPFAKELVRVLKFERAKGAASSMAEAMITALKQFGDARITHVPTANSRVRERGYDQAALVAKELAARCGQIYTPLLARTGNQRQLGQDRDVRLKQMEGAFRVLRPSLVQGKRILLIDDVLTTGATCEAAARALRQAGAKRVSALVFAVA